MQYLFFKELNLSNGAIKKKFIIVESYSEERWEGCPAGKSPTLASTSASQGKIQGHYSIFIDNIFLYTNKLYEKFYIAQDVGCDT